MTTIVRSDIVRLLLCAEKERKVRVALGASSIPGQIVAAMTEGIDVAQAFFRAMTDAQRADFWRREAAKNRTHSFFAARFFAASRRQKGVCTAQ